MAKAHSYLWLKLGRHDAERKRFAALMRKVEKVRVRDRLTLRVLAAETGTTRDVVGEWLAGRTIGRAESIEKIRQFLRSRENA